MATNEKIEKLKEHFKPQIRFNVGEAFQYFAEFEPEISRNAVILRLNKWVKKGYINRIGKGIFSIEQKAKYIPYIEEEIRKLYKKLHIKFPYTEFCIWNNKVFNEFMVHQPGRFYTLVEAEKEATEFVFNFLKSKKHEVFLNPDETITNLYTVFTDNCLIVKNLISEAPLHKADNISTYTLEKILVDAFCDTNIFAAQQETELGNIFTGAFEKYAVNVKSMLRYAGRRNRKDEIIGFLKSLKIRIYIND